MPATNQEIIKAAAEAAKVPGMLVRAGTIYNAVLEWLAETYDLVETRATHTFTFNGPTGSNSGPYALPTDWLREERGGLTYNVDSTPFVPTWVDQTQFKRLWAVTGAEPLPLHYTIDAAASPPTMHFWPPPTAGYPVEVIYYRRMDPIVAPETSVAYPWFPHSLYLIKRLQGELMQTPAGDSRAGEVLASAQDMLDSILKRSQRGTNSAVRTVSLDPRLYGRGAGFGGLAPTKDFPW